MNTINANNMEAVNPECAFVLQEIFDNSNNTISGIPTSNGNANLPFVYESGPQISEATGTYPTLLQRIKTFNPTNQNQSNDNCGIQSQHLFNMPLNPDVQIINENKRGTGTIDEAFWSADSWAPMIGNPIMFSQSVTSTQVELADFNNFGNVTNNFNNSPLCQNQNLEPVFQMNSQRFSAADAVLHEVMGYKNNLIRGLDSCYLEEVLNSFDKFITACNAREMMIQVSKRNRETYILVIDGCPISRQTYAKAELQVDSKRIASVLFEAIYTTQELETGTLKSRILRSGIKSEELDRRRISVINKLTAWILKNRGVGEAYDLYNPNDPLNPDLSPEQKRQVREALGQKRNNCNQARKQAMKQEKLAKKNKVVGKRVSKKKWKISDKAQNLEILYRKSDVNIDVLQEFFNFPF